MMKFIVFKLKREYIHIYCKKYVDDKNVHKLLINFEIKYLDINLLGWKVILNLFHVNILKII